MGMGDKLADMHRNFLNDLKDLNSNYLEPHQRTLYWEFRDELRAMESTLRKISQAVDAHAFLREYICSFCKATYVPRSERYLFDNYDDQRTWIYGDHECGELREWKASKGAAAKRAEGGRVAIEIDEWELQAKRRAEGIVACSPKTDPDDMRV